MSSGEVFGILLMFGLVSGLPFLVGLLIGYRWRARTHPQAKPDVPATDRQRAYLASLAIKREDGEAVMERDIAKCCVCGMIRRLPFGRHRRRAHRR